MEWGDLHWGIKYFLLQELVLDAPVRFEAGHRFDYLSETGLPGVQTIVLEMKANDCPFPELGSDLVLVKPDGVNPAGRDNRVAIRMEPGCHLEIYVEAADYYSASVFRD